MRGRGLAIAIVCVLVFSAILHVASPAVASVEVTEEWVARYEGPYGISGDSVRDIAVDSSGNVYVTGWSHEPDSDTETMITVAYDSAGNELWVGTFNDDSSWMARAFAIALGPSENIYVTGHSCPEKYRCDIVTIAYNPSGSELWVARYDGPGGRSDQAYDIVVDDNETVYVTGHNDRDDYVTVAYDSDGNELWVAMYGGPRGSSRAKAIALGPSGNIYVAGSSQDKDYKSEFATVAYDPMGNELWVARYDDPFEDDGEKVVDMVADSSGNVYVTGQTWRLVPGPGFSGTRYDYVTVAYDSNGKQLWVARYEGSDWHRDLPYAIAVGPSGNIYVTGGSWTDATEFDYATVAYDLEGRELWVAKYDGPVNKVDYAVDVATDQVGNIYITGTSQGEEGPPYWTLDYATVAYDPSGNQLWAKRYNGPANNKEGAYALAVDGDGNVYVTGQSVGNGTGGDIVTIKYSQEWVPTLDIDPDTLNLRSRGRWITAYLELSGGKNLMDIDVSTLLLNGTIPAEMWPTEIGDYDEDGVPDLMVKFNRTAVQEYIKGLNISGGGGGTFGYEITMTITGMFNDGTPFECSDTIRVLPAERMGIDLIEGPVWTTDMPYPEMRSKAEKLSRKDTVAVEMKCSALFGLGDFRDVEVGGSVVISDTPFPEWRFDPEKSERDWESAGRVIANAARRMT